MYDIVGAMKRRIRWELSPTAARPHQHLSSAAQHPIHRLHSHTPDAARSHARAPDGAAQPRLRERESDRCP